MMEELSGELVEYANNVTIKIYRIVFNSTLEVFYLKRYSSSEGSLPLDEFWNNTNTKLEIGRDAKFNNTETYQKYSKACELIKAKNI